MASSLPGEIFSTTPSSLWPPDVREQYLDLLKDAGLLDVSHATDEGSGGGGAARRPGGRFAVGGRHLNRNSGSWPAVKACLVAGLYPNLARLDMKRNRASFYIKDIGVVKPHPGLG